MENAFWECDGNTSDSLKAALTAANINIGAERERAEKAEAERDTAIEDAANWREALSEAGWELAAAQTRAWIAGRDAGVQWHDAMAETSPKGAITGIADAHIFAAAMLRGLQPPAEFAAAPSPVPPHSGQPPVDVRRLVATPAVLTLCEGCPPIGYQTDETRCKPCPRRSAEFAAASEKRTQITDGLKRGEVLSFVDGVLTVNISGYGSNNGDGYLGFHDDNLSHEEDGIRRAKIPNSELVAIRDFLNRVLPLAAPVDITPPIDLGWGAPTTVAINFGSDGAQAEQKD
ncbi:MAG: hypothetical protein WDN46_10085 [Methylocella sp.]